jgi:Glycosyltransferase family 87
MPISSLVSALRRIAPYILCAVGVIALAAGAIAFNGSSGYGYDYAAYDGAARRIASGLPLYLPGTAEAYNAGLYNGLYLYAPPAAVLMLPVTLLTTAGATLAWFAARICVLVAACWGLPVRLEVRAAILGVAGLSLPVLFDLNLGNLSIVVFALAVVAWRYRGRWPSRVAVALLLLVRYPSFTVIISWLLRRRFRDVAFAVACAVGISAATVAIVGLSTWVDYVMILRSLGNISQGEHNVAVGTLAASLGVPAVIGTVANISGYAVGLAAIGWSALREDEDVADVVGLTAPLLVAPFFHPHYLVILLLPAALLAERRHWWGLVLPLLAWLPDPVLPLVAAAAIGGPLITIRGVVRGRKEVAPRVS